QHRILKKAFGDELALAPITLHSHDLVLESGAGTGIWAQEFSAFHSQNNVLLNIECIDISDKQFPREYPSNIHFSIHSVTDLPQEWKNSFSYIHQLLRIDDIILPDHTLMFRTCLLIISSIFVSSTRSM
ncbi:hypothetical protein BDP27DRAFT_1236583, partial [Rhodocollybia butyracea]